MVSLEKSLSVKSGYGQLPYSIRLCSKLLLVILIAFITVQCQAILIPLYFAALISILLLPLANALERIKMPRALASLMVVLIALIIISFTIYLLSAQIITFLNDIPAIKQHLAEHYSTLQLWIEQQFSISASVQKTLVNNAAADVQGSGIVYVKQTFFTVAQTVAFIIFILIYAFLILYYRSIIKKFIAAVFVTPDKKSIDAVLTGTKQVVKNYMTGLVIEMIIISTSNSIVLMIIGIKYAIFLGVFTGILNIIPFIGIYTGIIFTVLITLTTSASMSQIVWIIIGLLAVHFVDSNFLMPRIVGSKVKINALMTILGAVAGGLLLGFPGVFLALPTIAILKIIFDRIEVMKPWAMLLGDESDFPGKRMVKKINDKLMLKKVSKGNSAT
jgi:predicted PurR-regulated permease PerM